MSNLQDWQVEWLVAALSPWTISPHPNFRQREVGWPARLALVTELRDTIETRKKPQFSADSDSWAEDLVYCAQASLMTGSQEEASVELLEICESRDLPFGARAAAGLFATVAFCEIEQHGVAIDLLDRLIDELTNLHNEHEDYLPSQRLIIAALSLQLGARQAECSKFEESLITANETLRWLPRLDDTRLQHFPVSHGISWGAATVQRDIIRSIKHSALALKAYLEQIGGGGTWSQVLRGRSSWVNLRIHLRSAERDELVLRDAFEERIDATSNTRHIARTTAETNGYRSLILAELSGHLNLIRREREQLGKVLLLGQPTEPDRVREALRLLRQSKATKPLRSSIAWLRNDGPTVALTNDASIVISRVNHAGWCTEQDLLILEGASDFLSAEQRRSAIDAALQFPKTPQLHGGLSWMSWEKVWKTVTKLVPESNQDDRVAEESYTYIFAISEIVQPLANTLSRLVSAIDWNHVNRTTASHWIAWAKRAETNPDNAVLLQTVKEQVEGVPPELPSVVGIEMAVHLADKGRPECVPVDTLSAVESYLLTTLRQEMESAHRGSLSFGGYQTLNVASAFALRFPTDSLWSQIVSNILDPRIDVLLKDDAVDRIAFQVENVPVMHARKLRSGITSILDSARTRRFMENSSSPIFSEAVRLAAALNAIPTADLLNTLLTLSCSTAKDRIQAAKTIPLCLKTGDATWGHVLLLQLSHDSDPYVRASASAGLVDSLKFDSSLNKSIYSRIGDALNADSVKIPLYTLHSIQRSAMDNERAALKPLMPQVAHIAQTGSNLLVRGAANYAFQMFSKSA